MSKEKPVEEQKDEHSVDDLLREMREKAESEKAEILRAAESKVQEIEENSRRQCERAEVDAIAEVDAQLSSDRDRILGEVRSGAREERLDLKRSKMKSVFEKARTEIERRIGGDGYSPALAALIREGLDFVGPDAEVRVSDDDLSLCRKIVSSNKLDCTVAGGGGGRGSVIAISSDGRRRVENGLETRLSRVEEAMSADVAQILFG